MQPNSNLFKITKDNACVDEVSADKAYSVSNLSPVHQRNTHIPFKCNTAAARDLATDVPLLLIQSRRILNPSQAEHVESTFSMIKPFGGFEVPIAKRRNLQGRGS
jgi:hypothetical protein